MSKEQILEAIKVMTVLELNDLVKALEEEWKLNLPSFIKDLKKLKKTPIYPEIKTLVFETIPFCQSLTKDTLIANKSREKLS